MKKDRTEKVITDNSSEKIIVKWDTERFALVRKDKLNPINTVILFNPVEAMTLLNFLASCGKEA